MLGGSCTNIKLQSLYLCNFLDETHWNANVNVLAQASSASCSTSMTLVAALPDAHTWKKWL